MQNRTNISSTFSKYCTGYCGFGFNGQEKTDEVSGVGNHLDFKYRGYDSQTGRFWSVDPLFKDYPWNSTYCFAENDVIRAMDLEGAEKKINTYNIDFYGSKMSISKVSSKDVNDPFKLGNGILNFYQGQKYNIRKGMESYAVATYQETNNLGQTSKFQYGYSKSVDDSYAKYPSHGTFWEHWGSSDPANEGAKIPENGSVSLGGECAAGWGFGGSIEYAWDKKGGKSLLFSYYQVSGYSIGGGIQGREYKNISSVDDLKGPSGSDEGGVFIFSAESIQGMNNKRQKTYSGTGIGIGAGASFLSGSHKEGNSINLWSNTKKDGSKK